MHRIDGDPVPRHNGPVIPGTDSQFVVSVNTEQFTVVERVISLSTFAVFFFVSTFSI